MADVRDVSPLTFFDVETTGLTSEDRVVSLGVIHVSDTAGFRGGFTTASATHLIFNPERNSHPRARAVHGYPDDLLRQQEKFVEHAGNLSSYFEHSGRCIAHNVSFDRRFILKEFELTGRPLRAPEFFCTMLEYRRQHEGRAGLDAVLKHMEIPPRSGHHGALADAWYSMAVYRWLHGLPIPSLEELPTEGPLNLRELQPHAAHTSVEASAVPTVESKRAKAFDAAVALLEPMATLMMYVAHADGEVLQSEVEAISLLMHTTLTGRAHGLSDAQQQDLLAYLVDLYPTADGIRLACSAVVQDANMRNSIAGWVRQVTYADGEPSQQENVAIMQIADSMRSVRQQLGLSGEFQRQPSGN